MYNKIFRDIKTNNNYVFETVENWNKGIYVEVDKNKIPEKVKKMKIGGCGTSTYVGDVLYFTSNTSGELLYKTFKYVTYLPCFKIKNEENLIELKDKNISFSKGFDILTKALKRENLEFTLHSAKFDDLFNINDFDFEEYLKLESQELKRNIFALFSLKLNQDDFLILEHELENISCFKELIKNIFKEQKVSNSILIEFVFKFDKNNLKTFEKIYQENYKYIDKISVIQVLDSLSFSESKWVIKKKNLV